MSEAKKIDVSAGSFTANGRKYRVAEVISVERFKQYEKLEPKLTFGLSFEEMFKNLRKAYDATNEQRFADASVIIHNMMSGIKDLENDKRIHPALAMCALVINFEGEDTGVYDEAVTLQKIDDWTKEGLNMLDFFTLALNSIRGFRETYLLFIQEQAKREVSLFEKDDEMERKSQQKNT